MIEKIMSGVRLFAIASIPVALQLSPNAEMWIASMIALVVASWIVGRSQSYPVLLWILGINWLSIVADIMNADLINDVWSHSSFGPYRKEAVFASLCSLVAMATGMQIGVRLGRWGTPGAASEIPARNLNLSSVVIAFVATYPFVMVLYLIASAAPGLQQPILGFALLRFVFLYLLVATVFELDRGYAWLSLAILLELLIGITGFFASYKEAVFILLIAGAAHNRKLPAKVWSFGGLALILVIWLSLAWTAIKPEYRFWVSGNTGTQTITRPFGERVDFIAEHLFSNTINYEAAYFKLLRRIGYTEYYARILARIDAGVVDSPNLYVAAIEHVLMPRLLFPEKSSLNDSAITTALTGDEIGENTSISVGYVAEAHADFGFPGMLLPIALLGMLMGASAHYFMTRPAPLVIRQAVTTASLFSAFAYEANIDKALGGYLVGTVALALALKFGYPILAKWLETSPRSSTPFQYT
jgi:hypothetical protein